MNTDVYLHRSPKTQVGGRSGVCVCVCARLITHNLWQPRRRNLTTPISELLRSSFPNVIYYDDDARTEDGTSLHAASSPVHTRRHPRKPREIFSGTQCTWCISVGTANERRVTSENSSTQDVTVMWQQEEEEEECVDEFPSDSYSNVAALWQLQIRAAKPRFF